MLPEIHKGSISITEVEQSAAAKSFEKRAEQAALTYTRKSVTKHQICQNRLSIKLSDSDLPANKDMKVYEIESDPPSLSSVKIIASATQPYL